MMSVMNATDGTSSSFQGRIVFDHEGRWVHDGVEITHDRTLALLNRSLRRSPSGDYFVEVAGETAPVFVEDAPYVVRRVAESFGPEGSLDGITLWLNDATSERLDPDSLEVGRGDVLYCKVKNGSFHARFLRPPYYHLAEHFKEDTQTGEYFLRLGSMRHRIGSRRQLD